MNISDRSINETIDAIVCEYRRFSSPEYSQTVAAIYHQHVVSVGKLRGIQMLLSSVRFSRLIDENVELLADLRNLAENRLADVGRSPVQSAEVVGWGSK